MSNLRCLRSRPTRRNRVAVFLFLVLVSAVMAIQASPAFGWFTYYTDGPGTTIGGNTIVDIKYDGTYFWLATSRGVTRATPDGTEFVNFGSDVFDYDEISAIALEPGVVWASPSYSEVRSEQLIPYGAGFSVTTNGGNTWNSFLPEQADGPGKICYDLAILDADHVNWAESSVWASCFYGGLVYSTDGGTTWTNLFPSPEAETDYNNQTFARLDNRFFAVVTDNTSDDSLEVWGGTAAGIKKFVYIKPTLKLTGTYAADLFKAGDTIWVATDDGLSVTLDAGESWRTYSEDDGFPTPYVSSAVSDLNGMWAGVGSFLDTVGAGIMYSPDAGQTWEVSEPAAAMGDGRLAVDFAYVNGATYAACGPGGLIYTTDNGATWQSDLPSNAGAGAYYSLVTQSVDPDTTILWAGTDDYLYEFIFTSSPVPDSLITYNDIFGATTGSSSIEFVDLQSRPNGELVLWTVHEALPALALDDGFARLRHLGTEEEAWEFFFGSIDRHSVAFDGSVFYLAGEQGLMKDSIDAEIGGQYTIESLNTLMGGNDGVADVKSMLAFDNTIWVGTDLGLAVSPDSGQSWSAIVSNPSPGVPDDTVTYIYNANDISISGNFVTALGMSMHPGGHRIWAATQQTSSAHSNGISVTQNDGETWDIVLSDVLVWNFAFDGATVYAASSDGLLISPDYGASWDTISVFIDQESGAQIPEFTEVYAVGVVGDTVWVGTENGLAISFDDAATWRIVRDFESLTAPGVSGEPYATPIPWSPSDRITPGPIQFHFVPPADGPVKITIYDFSNRIVIELEDGISRDAGVQYDETHTWDGKNEKGDFVSLGTYFFVIEYGDGSTQWGKLVVLP